jgi:23S rRNA pseudouridine1911/1915/1917 synthase
VKIVYKDNGIVVAEKSFGEISELPDVIDPKAEYTPLLIRGELESNGEAGELFTVHRLDRTTAGLMVYARTSHAAAELSKELQDGRMTKVYRAAVHGKPSELSGEMRDYLYFDRRKGKSFTAEKKRNGTKEAILRYEWLESRETRFGEISLMRVALVTGRTHQIRVQFGSRGMPLLGDGKYGSRANYKGGALFSSELSFTHPETGEPMAFFVEPKISFE